MPMSYKARRRWSLVVLLVWLPAYIGFAVWLMTWLEMETKPTWFEFLAYIILGIAWAIPFRSVFRGVGRADPDAAVPPGQD